MLDDRRIYPGSADYVCAVEAGIDKPHVRDGAYLGVVGVPAHDVPDEELQDLILRQRFRGSRHVPDGGSREVVAVSFGDPPAVSSRHVESYPRDRTHVGEEPHRPPDHYADVLAGVVVGPYAGGVRISSGPAAGKGVGCQFAGVVYGGVVEIPSVPAVYPVLEGVYGRCRTVCVETFDAETLERYPLRLLQLHQLPLVHVSVAFVEEYQGREERYGAFHYVPAYVVLSQIPAVPERQGDGVEDACRHESVGRLLDARGPLLDPCDGDPSVARSLVTVLAVDLQDVFQRQLRNEGGG